MSKVETLNEIRKRFFGKVFQSKCQYFLNFAQNKKPRQMYWITSTGRREEWEKIYGLIFLIDTAQ